MKQPVYPFCTKGETNILANILAGILAHKGVRTRIALSQGMVDLPSLILLPGLGVDGRIYGPQKNLPHRILFAEWIEPESQRESLAHYAVRMSARLEMYKDAYIGGISLGAMVAMEVARSLSVLGVISIGGCSSSRQISPLFRATLKIGAMLPSSGIRLATALAPLALKTAENLKSDHVDLMCRMLREHSPEQTRWSCRAILEWENNELDDAAPTYRIHGENDEVIPLRNVKAQHVVPNGRHLISLSHPTEVNQFILDKTSLHSRFTST